MLRRTLRAVLFAIVTIALWTVARPAHAMPAPFCDDRGATAIAEPPLLVAPEIAVHRAIAAASCDAEDVVLGATVAPGQGDARASATQAEPAVPATPPVLAPAESSSTSLAPAVLPVADGVRSELERPPRA
jgi:hypothetical protein